MTPVPILGGRYLVHPDGYVVGRRGRPMKPFGHPRPILHLVDANGKDRWFRLARLVAEMFIGRPPHPLAIVGHRDGDPTNCAASNLYWTDRPPPPKPRGPRPRYTAEEVCQIAAGDMTPVPILDGRYLVHPDGYVVGRYRRPIKPFGYPRPVVQLVDANGELRRFRLARLVAQAFIGRPPHPLAIVGHRDGDPTNCAASNLYWTDRPPPNPHGHGSRFTAEEARQIAADYLDPSMTLTAVAKKWGADHATITRIAKGITTNFRQATP